MSKKQENSIKVNTLGYALQRKYKGYRQWWAVPTLQKVEIKLQFQAPASSSSLSPTRNTVQLRQETR